MTVKWWWRWVPCTSEVGWVIRSLDPYDGLLEDS